MGDSRELFHRAIKLLKLRLGVINCISSFYVSPPWGFQHENNFINQAVELNTVLQPNEILKNCLEIEQKLGRERISSDDYQARTIDIDILLFNTETINFRDLIFA